MVRWSEEYELIKKIHNFIRRKKIKPNFCEGCGKVPPLDLSNKDHKYSLNPEDYRWLCRKCHFKLDGKDKYFKLGRLKNKDLSKRTYFNGRPSPKRRKCVNGKIQCPKCKEFKRKDEFQKDNHRWDKLSYKCKSCSSILKKRIKVKDESAANLGFIEKVETSIEQEGDK